MRPLLVLLVTAALLGADDAPANRPPAVMLVAVPAPLPTPPVAEPTAPSPVLDPCERYERAVLLSIGPGLEPSWQWESNGADPAGTVAPTCASPSGALVTPDSQ